MVFVSYTYLTRWDVHHMANKKYNLHSGSLTAIKRDKGLKATTKRKVSEGKSRLSVLNAVKNKSSGFCE
ncbi:hypothetical protein DQQ10_09855 [Pseudochryseolinea flava]|uniref:Uncharacterized protein n=1 Tax=Pseudochryseolinea flava TaxID=2059302 RepID=A0A364Y3A7_9BACT|nr:hypothetical protein DQQ10_09855 [Pseudochryseolinea flava]